MTVSERTLWNAIKGRQLGARFRRQVPIGRFIVDFGCLDPKIAIEVDGSVHDWSDETYRTEFLEARGFTVLRFANDDVAFGLEGVIEVISDTVEELRPRPGTETGST